MSVALGIAPGSPREEAGAQDLEEGNADQCTNRNCIHRFGCVVTIVAVIAVGAFVTYTVATGRDFFPTQMEIAEFIL